MFKKILMNSYILTCVRVCVRACIIQNVNITNYTDNLPYREFDSFTITPNPDFDKVIHYTAMLSTRHICAIYTTHMQFVSSAMSRTPLQPTTESTDGDS